MTWNTEMISLVNLMKGKFKGWYHQSSSWRCLTDGGARRWTKRAGRRNGPKYWWDIFSLDMLKEEVWEVVSEICKIRGFKTKLYNHLSQQICFYFGEAGMSHLLYLLCFYYAFCDVIFFFSVFHSSSLLIWIVCNNKSEVTPLVLS